MTETGSETAWRENSDNGNDQWSDENERQHAFWRWHCELGKFCWKPISLYRTRFLSWFIGQTIWKKKSLLNAGVLISSLKMEYKSLQDFIKENYKTKIMDYIAISRSIFHLQVRVEVTE